MLKIEVIKFEAQDVITTSVAAPTEAPTEPPVECICGNACDPNEAGVHLIFSREHPNGIACPAKDHDCDRPE